MSEGTMKLRCDKCNACVATVGLYIQPRAAIRVYCETCTLKYAAAEGTGWMARSLDNALSNQFDMREKLESELFSHPRTKNVTRPIDGWPLSSTCVWCSHGDHDMHGAAGCSCACHGKGAL